MSRRQVQACAARMPEELAAAFLALTAASDDLFLRSVELRRQAWQLYRNTTGLPKGHKLPKATERPAQKRTPGAAAAAGKVSS